MCVPRTNSFVRDVRAMAGISGSTWYVEPPRGGLISAPGWSPQLVAGGTETGADVKIILFFGHYLWFEGNLNGKLEGQQIRAWKNNLSWRQSKRIEVAAGNGGPLADARRKQGSEKNVR